MGAKVSIRGRVWATYENDCLHTSCVLDLLQGLVNCEWERVDTTECLN